MATPKTPLRIASLWALIISISLTAIGGIFVLLFPDIPYEEEVLISGLLIAVYSLVGLGCAVVLPNRRALPVVWGALVLSGIALAIWLFLIWGDAFWFSWRGTKRIAEVATPFTFAGLVCVHAGLLYQARLRSRKAKISRSLAVVCSSFTAIVIILLVWEVIGQNDFDEIVLRLIGIALIVGTLATLLTFAFARLDSLGMNTDDAEVDFRPPIDITCPRCGQRQTIRSGRQEHCTGCRLRITIDVEEPRCDCGYLLYALDADVCPECGRPIAEKVRWTAHATSSDPDNAN